MVVLRKVGYRNWAEKRVIQVDPFTVSNGENLGENGGKKVVRVG